jgi:Tat protein translocase TatC
MSVQAPATKKTLKASSVEKKPVGSKSTKAKGETKQPSKLAEYKPYIKELRGAFFKTLVFFALGAVVGMIYYRQILSVVIGFFKLEGVNLVLTSPYQFLDLAINTGFFIGLIFCFPIFLYYLLKFTKPALKSQEFKLLVQLLPSSIVLLIVGFGFGVWVLQFVIDLFSQTSTSFELGNIWDLSGFISQVIIMGISLAFVFQLPIIITGLIRLKIVSHKAVKEKRRLIYAGLLLFAALLPPTDLIALAILTLIPLFLFEITLLLNQRVQINV